jgi:6-pyruvoyltetrahydropterin/6-carboxytetrahydropterin synthase
VRVDFRRHRHHHRVVAVETVCAYLRRHLRPAGVEVLVRCGLQRHSRPAAESLMARDSRRHDGDVVVREVRVRGPAEVALLLRTFAALTRSLPVAIPIALATALRLAAAFGARSTLCRWRGTLLVAPRLAGSLLELLKFLLHEAARLRILSGAKRVVAAVRAAPPAFRIGAVAVRAEDAFRQGHRGRRALYTSAVPQKLDSERRKTLETLLALAEDSNPGACFDDLHAEELLRSQSSPEELRAVGASERAIDHIFRGGQQPSRVRTGEVPVLQQGTYSVRVEARFESAHFLREYRGISEPLHGHSYKVEADLATHGGGVDGDAIAVDFVSAKRKLEALAKRLDYGCINDVPPFTEINPSAENIASWFHRELSSAVADENALVVAVTIWEGPVNSVTYKP